MVNNLNTGVVYMVCLLENVGREWNVANKAGGPSVF